MDDPDFYLSSSEGYDLEEPRRCWIVKRVRTTTRDDLLLLRVDPPIIGQRYGLGGRDIDEVIVAPRHHGVSMFPVSEWPVYVHVARLIRDEAHEPFQPGDLSIIAWAELHQTEVAARQMSQR
jgi:hypothetical protein